MLQHASFIVHRAQQFYIKLLSLANSAHELAADNVQAFPLLPFVLVSRPAALQFVRRPRAPGKRDFDSALVALAHVDHVAVFRHLEAAPEVGAVALLLGAAAGAAVADALLAFVLLLLLALFRLEPHLLTLALQVLLLVEAQLPERRLRDLRRHHLQPVRRRLLLAPGARYENGVCLLRDM